jgi:alpha-N-acetylglucosaminidase
LSNLNSGNIDTRESVDVAIQLNQGNNVIRLNSVTTTAFAPDIDEIELIAKANTPIEDLLNRIGGAGASDKIITSVVAGTDSKDYFTITSESGKPKIVGNNYLSVATGIHWYLKYYAYVTLTWNQLTTDLSGVTLPVPTTAETHNTNLKYRYYLNYCTYSYSMAFWDWNRWQQEIDWMALHGVNMPLALTGTDVVWYNVLTKKLGYTPTEANNFVAGSGFQAWFLMNNLEGWGGPNPDNWYAQQEVLQKQIVARMRELNMQPVLPGYSGMVPSDIKAKLGWNVADPGSWNYFKRPGFLQPSDAHFNEIAQYYYDEMKDLYGTSQYYSMDPFHEGGNTSGVDINAAYKAVYKAMKDYSGAATTPQWVIQSWHSNPLQAALDALDPGTLVILDLFSDGTPKWSNSYKQSNGNRHEFVYCMLNNFGGRTGLHGRLEKTINGFYDAKAQFPATMLGVGATMEGIENNPMLYEALYELPWRATKLPASEWINGYAQIRYGTDNEAAKQAWQLLLGSVYNCTTTQEGTTESLLCARPSLTADKVSTWSTANIYWNPSDVREAAALLLSQSDVLSGSNYEYDVVDVVRQVLADYANGLLKRINAAGTTDNKRPRNALSDKFLQVILNQDKLMNTTPDFMVGTWINHARNLGTTTVEKNLYEKNARMLITTWGDQQPANSGGLHDYSNREWGGLLKDYYYPRWQTFFNYLKNGGTAPNSTSFFNMEWAWATQSTSAMSTPYPTTAQGDPIAIAKEVFASIYMTITAEGATTEKALAPTEGTLTLDQWITAYRGNTLEIKLPAQPLAKLYIDFNNDGIYSADETFEAINYEQVTINSSIITVPVPANATPGEKSFLLLTDVETGNIAPNTTPLCGLKLTGSIIVMDEITTPRMVTVNVANAAQGSASIDGATTNSVTNQAAVTVRATPKIGYLFDNWTNAAGTVVGTTNPYVYYDPASVTLTTNFKAGGTTYTMTDETSIINFNPPLSTQDKWVLKAETTFKGTGVNQWGSAILTNMTDPFGTTNATAFQLYLHVPGNNNGTFIFKDAAQETITATPNINTSAGTPIKIELLSATGNGKVLLTVEINDTKFTKELTIASFPVISKATKYPMTVNVTSLDNQTDISPVLPSEKARVYGQNGRIVIDGLQKSDRCRLFTLSGSELDYRTSGLPRGIYIVKINSDTYKVIMTN